MAKIEKLKKGTSTIYPATIPQAVVDPTSGKSARAELDEKANHGYDSAPKTLKEVDEAKIDKTSIVGETGQGEASVMSQKAVTNELATKASHGYESSPKTLKEIDDSVSQLAGEVEQLAYVKIKNEVVNGNFGNETTGWAILGTPVITITDNIATITPNTLGAGIWSNTNFKIDNTYYFRVGVKGTMNFRLRVGLSGAVEYQTNNIEYPDWNTFTYQRKMVNNGVALHLLGNADIQFQLQRVQAINLTEIFGVGNEPTKEEMNLLISTLGIDYFEGEITIPAQKIMQWQLALIRKNKNAIIALDGTII